MGESFHWGIIGPGRIAHKFAQGIQVINDADLYAIASTSSKRAQAFANQYKAEKAYSNYEEMVNDPNVDAVYIAVPHPFHFENAMLCLEAGKPVLCEKPLTVNSVESAKLIETARKKSLFLMEALWTRYLPIYRQVREWLVQGVIGEVKLLTFTMGFLAEFNATDRLFNPDLAGGALLDLGIYPISISQWIYGKNPAAFSVNSHFARTGVDDFTSIQLQYDDGAISQFSCGFLMDTLNELVIYGTKGRIHIHPDFWYSSRATLHTDKRESTVTKPLRGSGFEYETEEAMRCIREGKIESPDMPHAQSQANMELMDAIRKEIGLSYPFEK